MFIYRSHWNIHESLLNIQSVLAGQLKVPVRYIRDFTADKKIDVSNTSLVCNNYTGYCQSEGHGS